VTGRAGPTPAPRGMRRRAALEDLIRPGSTVALSDGAGMPTSILPRLSAAARAAGDVHLLLGWCLGSLDGLDTSAFKSVRTFLGGYGARGRVERGEVRQLPVRLGAVPALLAHLRPDVLVTSIGPRGRAAHFTTEVSWLRAAAAAGAVLAGIERPALPVADAGPCLPEESLWVVDADASPPVAIEWGEPGDVDRLIGERVAALVPAGARLQFGPGSIGRAVLEALEVPVVVDSGILSDGVVALAQRGLLLPHPMAAYLAGSDVLYEWARGQRLLHGVETTHDVSRLARATAFVSVNTALEVDLDGQVNVESVGGAAIASAGGHPDFSFAATSSPGGLSVVALRSSAAGCSTLVERLSAPVSTPAHDVDVIVTEHGHVDLRGKDRRERRAAIRSLWKEG